MKRIYLMLFFLSFLSCNIDSHDENIPLSTSKILGSWQIISESYSIGGPEINETVENGPVYNFNLDGTFTFVCGAEPSQNFYGTFIFDNNLLTMNDMPEGNRLNREVQVFFKGNTITFVPWKPVCIEGCSTVLEKIIYLAD